jgi:thiosulfate/3-mercaptopyruvate sulfurtransferase
LNSTAACPIFNLSIRVWEYTMLEGYANPGVLVDTDWVAEHLDDHSVVTVEVNTDLQAGYDQGHVPGAIGWGLHTDLEDQTRRDIARMSQLEGLLGRSGIDNDTTVVLYGDGNNRSATYAFWVLKYYRHDDVRLMDGGRQRWLDEGRPLTTEPPTPEAKSYKGRIPDRTLRATKDHIMSNLRSSSMRLLDTRTEEEYRGTLGSAPGTTQAETYRSGRIPGAVLLPWDEGAAGDGTFKSAEELRRMYLDKGVSPDQEVVVYCRLGVRASYSWFVLKYLLGYERVRNYDGSWTEWGNSVGVPIETDASQATR